ncbi:MAG: DUF87 domain-containing protein [Planctomycetota bacterium]
MAQRSLFLGRDGGGDEVRTPTAALTTHGVIVGMTGSGKTGLGVVLLEEVLRSGTPVLVLDPKGDMGNLLLTFPELAPEEFTPWVGPVEASRSGQSPAEVGAALSARWREGLAGWGLGAEDVRALRERVEFGIYTPGSRAGTPLNVLGSLGAPAGADPEALLEEIQGLVSGLLGLIGIDADPLTSREHILLTNVIERAWRKGEDLDLPRLIQQVQSPPLRKLGVFELDAFYPAPDRLGLAMRLNGLVANPAFAAWLEGEPLDPQRLLWTPDGKPRAAVVYLAHLSAEERQFVVALLLGRVASWMQTLPGSADLRALVYMDEVYGFCPPTAMPPAKRPLLTLLKQARAFGVGVVLATQNPVDLDYKAMSNAGTWFVGRLQTERDQARVADALAQEGSSPGELRAQLASLEKRSFLLRDPSASAPRTFATRWALSYLAGPLTRAQLGSLAAAPAPAAPAPAAPAPVEDATAVAPRIAEGVRVAYLDPAAPWADAVGARADATRLEPALAVRAQLVFDETQADLDHDEEWECVCFPLGEAFDPAALHVVDHDPRDLLDAPPPGASYALPAAKLHTKGYFKDLEKRLRDWLVRNRALALLRNPELKLYSRPGEDAAAFRARCAARADDEADREAATRRARIEKKLRAAQRAVDKAERALSRAEEASESAASDAFVGGLESVLGAFLGGRASASSRARRALRGARGVSRARAQAGRSQDRVERARDTLLDKREAIEALEDELYAETAAIDARWDQKAAAIEPFEVGLERADVDVSDVVLLWIPR